MLLLATAMGTLSLAVWASAAMSQPAADGPQFRDGDGLVRPTDYRSWPFIGAGLGMDYGEDGGTPDADAPPQFTHAFVNPSSYRHFMNTGEWPDGTVFMLEFRASASEASINTQGRFATELAFVEAEVKDSRFADGWAYYAFGRGDNLAAVAQPLDEQAAAPCVQCHTDHGAVERTFVQFYPTLLEVAREKGTLKDDY